MKKSKIIIYLIFLIHPFFSYSHVSHYDKFRLIEMDILRNGKKIGHNKYSFKNQNNLLLVKNEINFVAKLVGIKLLDVKGSSTETYKNGKLIKFKSNTIQNKKKKYNELILEKIISPLSGSLKIQEIYFLSKEIHKINNNYYNTSKFKIVMKKNNDDKKKEEFNVWLDDKSKIILKVSYSKFGDWEYIVRNIEKFD